MTSRPPDEATLPPRCVLVVGDDRVVTLPLPTHGEIVFGRDPGCDVALPHVKISRRHARLVVDSAGVSIEDLGSTNGIRVGGKRLERGVPVPLLVGERVSLGPYTLVVLVGRAAEQCRPAKVSLVPPA